MYNSKKRDEINDVYKRCLLMCGQEAVALDLPAEAGYAMHDGIVYCDYDDWDDETFQLWCTTVVDNFGWENENKLLELYTTCTQIMQGYGQLMERVAK